MKNLTKDIVQWDVVSWSKAFKYWDKQIEWNKVQTCLELGGRDGGASLWLALKQKHVICSDLHDTENTAKPLHEKYHVTHLIEYKDLDATQLPYENNFDVIIFKSIMGSVGQNKNYDAQCKMIKEIHKALKPGGKLLFAENLTASPFHRYLRQKYIKWGNNWRYISIDEMTSFLKDFSKVEFQTTGFLGVLGRNEKQKNILAKIDNAIFNNILPRHYKYIIYGIAEK